MNRFFLFFALLFLIGCKKEKPAKEVIVVNELPANFEMYKTSEMAALMRLMLAENQKLRAKIINGEPIDDFNEKYLKIHTAKLTDSTDLEDNFDTFAKHFISMQQQVYTVNKAQQKEQFNSTVDACIACHQNRCTGPIPKIERIRIP